MATPRHWGLVRSVDASSGVITIGTTTATGNKDIAIHAASTTILRRMPRGPSIRRCQAQHPRRNQDRRSIARSRHAQRRWLRIHGRRNRLRRVPQHRRHDCVNRWRRGSFTVNDLATKKNVEVKLLADSQLRKLPQPMAQRIAIGLKGASADASGPGGAAKPGAAPSAPSTAPAPQVQPEWAQVGAAASVAE